MLGALNALTHEGITLTNDSYINAERVCALLIKLAELPLGVPITLILDKARYQRCRIVQERAAALGIELLYLPAYSPNLNLKVRRGAQDASRDIQVPLTPSPSRR